MFTFWPGGARGEPSRRRAEETEGLQGYALEPLSLLTAELFRGLLHQADRLDGLRLRGVHVPGLASSLSFADQLGGVAAAALRASERARRLNILRAAPRRLDILRAAARGLHVLGAAAGTGERARRLNILRAAPRGLNI